MNFENSIDADEMRDILSKLSAGLWDLLKLRRDSISRDLYPKPLREGLSDLGGLAVRHGVKYFPRDLPEAFEFFHRKVGDWGFHLPPSANDIAEVFLLEDQELTMDAEEYRDFFIESHHNPSAEREQMALRHVVDLCRLHEWHNHYINFRESVIKSPVIERMELIQKCKEFPSELADLFEGVYERVPLNLIVDGELHTCGTCGWTLRQTADDGWICGHYRCRELSVTQGQPLQRTIDAGPSTYRVKEGIRRYTVSPGRFELALERRLKRVGLSPELWPESDRYDIRIVLPDSEAWAVDCKDMKIPSLWASKLNDLNFPSSPPWNAAYYVYPDYRLTLTPGFNEIIQARLELPEKIKCVSARELMSFVRRRIQRSA